MRVSRWWCVALLAASVSSTCYAAGTPACRTEVIEGSVEAGRPFVQAIGNGLLLALQPVRAGWILRVVPATTRPADVGQPGFHDYAELATPPYQSVTPLSLSTDFALRAQDAVGWNPRRFRFADSPAAYARLLAAYNDFERAGAPTNGPVANALAAEVAHTSEGILKIVDARLTAGTADQGASAAAVSANFPTTAHTLVDAPAGKSTDLGELLSLRFRVELELSASFKPGGPGTLLTHICGSR